MSSLKLQTERNDDSPLSMHVNVTDNSPNSEQYHKHYQQKYSATPSFPILILNNFDDHKETLSISEDNRLLLDQEDNDDKEEEEDDDDDDEIWRDNFMNFMSRLINYSETLESISIELLRTEGKVRELILLQKSIMEELEETEKMYIERINECEEISKRQNEYINELNEFQLELNGQVSNKRLTNSTISTIHRWQSSEHSQQEERRSLHSNTTVDSKFLLQKNYYDPVNILRWKLGLFIGGGIGNGNVIHSYHNPISQHVELIVIGTGTIATQYQKTYHFHKHDYLLHINYNDRRKKFHLLPRHLWTPDKQVTRCQFKINHTACSTTFTLFERRHHCRKCGHIICQRHSLNRLPLFNNLSFQEIWCRICDTCFNDLIVK